MNWDLRLMSGREHHLHARAIRLKVCSHSNDGSRRHGSDTERVHPGQGSGSRRPGARNADSALLVGRGHPRSATGPIGSSGVTRRGPNAAHRSAERPRRRDHRAGDPGVGGPFRICPPGPERTRGPESDPAPIESRTHRGHRSPRPNRARGTHQLPNETGSRASTVTCSHFSTRP